MAEKCAICLEDLVSDLGTAVPCGHCLHQDCFLRLKQDAETRRDADNDSRCKVIISCPVCKRRVKKFHKVYLTVAPPRMCQSDSSATEHSVYCLRSENARLHKRLRELTSLSNDQSELLFRILPRYDHLEGRYCRMKREKRELQKELESAQDENWQFLLDSFEVRSQLLTAVEGKRHLERKIEEVDCENSELQATWNCLQEKLTETVETSTHEMRELRSRIKDRNNELRDAKAELVRLRAGSTKLKEELIRSNDEVARLHKKLRRAPSSRKRNTKSRKLIRRAILIQP